MNKEMQKVIDECFWGEYKISADEALKKIHENDLDYIRFFISRIIENSSFPSAGLKSLFSEDQLKEYLPESSDNIRINKKIKLVRANLFNEVPDKASGIRQWQ